MAVQTRVARSADAVELFVTATPNPGLPLGEQAARCFRAVAEELRAASGHLLQERVFAAGEAIETVLAARRRAYGPLDDGVPPAVLVTPPGAGGLFAGVQAHAVAGPAPWTIEHDGEPVGRAVHSDGHTMLAVSGLSAPEADGPAGQAEAMLRRSARLLAEQGGSFRDVARTWLWLGDILDWYDAFNRVRNGFFVEQGLIGPEGGALRLPASTGIGLAPARAAVCGMDLVAMLGNGRSVDVRLAGGRQGSAYAYGSAFSRAAEARTPAGRTVYVSGTASIDTEGRTEHVGDPAGQIDATLANVRAVLRDFGCDPDRDVVQAIVYSKDADVERAFLARAGDLPWPHVRAIGDVCRDELLFEVEATAMPAADRP